MSRRVAGLGLVAVVSSVLAGSVPLAGSAAPVTDPRHEVEQMLVRRELAVRAADADLWRTTVADPAAAQLALFESLQQLNLGTWSEQLTNLEAADSSWRATVQVRYRLPGERADSVVDTVLDLTANLLVAGSTTTPMPPWEIAGVRTASRPNVLVVGAGSADRLHGYAAELEQAAASVGRLLGEPPPRMVLVIPETWDQAGRMDSTGVRPGLAAVTSVVERPGTATGAVRVLADAEVLARLNPATRTAVFGHEAFHVATLRFPAAPRWLSEGLADYAGYRESGADIGRAVAGAIRHVRAEGAPPELPHDDAFDDPRQATMAYEGAHLAVRLLVTEYGAADVVGLYREVGTENAAGIDAAVVEILGTDLTSITRAWRAELTSLAAR